MSARAGAIVAPFVGAVGALIFKNDDNAGFLVYGCFSLLSALLFIILPETLNKPLVDNIRELERSVRRGDRLGAEDGEARRLIE